MGNEPAACDVRLYVDFSKVGRQREFVVRTGIAYKGKLLAGDEVVVYGDSVDSLTAVVLEVNDEELSTKVRLTARHIS